MYDIYCLKIEVEYPGQMKLIDLILGVEHDQEEGNVWVLSMDYNEAFRNLPLYYVSHFMMILENKYDDLERIGIKREMISIWRCLIGTKEVFMEYWPKEMELMAAEGIRFRIYCHTLDEGEDEEFSYSEKQELPHC